MKTERVRGGSSASNLREARAGTSLLRVDTRVWGFASNSPAISLPGTKAVFGGVQPIPPGMRPARKLGAS